MKAKIVSAASDPILRAEMKHCFQLLAKVAVAVEKESEPLARKLRTAAIALNDQLHPKEKR